MSSVQSLWVYPCKSASAVKMQTAVAEESGFQGDRNLMLVDSKGKFVSQRSKPRLGLLSLTTQGTQVHLAFEGSAWNFPLPSEKDTREVRVWSDNFLADDLGDDVAHCLSKIFDDELRLVSFGEESERLVSKKYSDRDVSVSFADGFPYLITSQASLDDLNQRLKAKGEAEIPMGRFRPNIVVDGFEAYQEDRIERIQIGEAIFRLSKPCTRCTITTVSEETQKFSKEPLKTLMEYRFNDEVKGACFGQNAYLESGHDYKIQVGETVTILS